MIKKLAQGNGWELTHETHAHTLDRTYLRLQSEYGVVEIKTFDGTMLHALEKVEREYNTLKEQGPITKRPTIICLCGSTRFSQAFHDENLRETLLGRIVLSIGCDFKSDHDLMIAGDLTEEDKERLDELHLRKIDLADEILVLNVNGYIGQSTRREIEYAE